jgi:hypothetical protein
MNIEQGQRGCGETWRDVELGFPDGTPTAPLPKVTDADYLSTSVQSSVCLVGLSFLTLGTAWFSLRPTHYEPTSFPPHMLRAALVSICWSSLSFDERQNVSNKPRAVCSADSSIPMVMVMYAALWRQTIDSSKLLSMRRRAIGVKRVLLHFASCAAYVVSLVVWRFVDPLRWCVLRCDVAGTLGAVPKPRTERTTVL